MSGGVRIAVWRVSGELEASSVSDYYMNYGFLLAFAASLVPLVDYAGYGFK